MSHAVMIPDDLYRAIEEYAARRGETVEAAILAWAESLEPPTGGYTSLADSEPLSKIDDPSRIDDPRYDSWAGFRGVAEAKSADSINRHDAYLADDPLAPYLGKGELTSPDAIRRHDAATADEAVDRHKN